MEENTQSSSIFKTKFEIKEEEELEIISEEENFHIKSESPNQSDKEEDMNSTITINTSIKTEDEDEDKLNAKSSHSRSFSWPSLWKSGPRRSAFQPYKPTREAACSRADEDTDTEGEDGGQRERRDDKPRPASTTLMTNMQRGNMKAESSANQCHLSWFTMAGRGDLSDHLIQTMIDQGEDSTI